jgi:hypothetical protein
MVFNTITSYIKQNSIEIVIEIDIEIDIEIIRFLGLYYNYYSLKQKYDLFTYNI